MINKKYLKIKKYVKNVFFNSLADARGVAALPKTTSS